MTQFKRNDIDAIQDIVADNRLQTLDTIIDKIEAAGWRVVERTMTTATVPAAGDVYYFAKDSGSNKWWLIKRDRKA